MTIKVTREPNEAAVHETDCKKCNAGLQFTKADCRFVADPRDGNAYVLTCPRCGTENWIAATVLA